MSENKEMFSSMDESVKSNVRMINNNKILVRVKALSDNKLIQDVYCVP